MILMESGQAAAASSGVVFVGPLPPNDFLSKAFLFFTGGPVATPTDFTWQMGLFDTRVGVAAFGNGEMLTRVIPVMTTGPIEVPIRRRVAGKRFLGVLVANADVFQPRTFTLNIDLLRGYKRVESIAADLLRNTGHAGQFVVAAVGGDDTGGARRG